MRALVTVLATTMPLLAYAGSNTVLVELFTSEGCSSCPSADQVMSELREYDNVAVLGWHVDYWDYLGWTDRFGHADATPRQRAYAAALARGRMYTPQMVVNGAVEFVGSDRLRAKRSVETASERKGVPIEVRAQEDGGDLRITVAVDETAKSRGGDSLKVYAAITEDELVSEVTRGENAGRTLRHIGVVRKVFELGVLNGNELRHRMSTTIEWGWKVDQLNVVAWIQDAETLEVVGAGTARVR